MSRTGSLQHNCPFCTFSSRIQYTTVCIGRTVFSCRVIPLSPYSRYNYCYSTGFCCFLMKSLKQLHVHTVTETVLGPFNPHTTIPVVNVEMVFYPQFYTPNVSQSRSPELFPFSLGSRCRQCCCLYRTQGIVHLPSNYTCSPQPAEKRYFTSGTYAKLIKLLKACLQNFFYTKKNNNTASDYDYSNSNSK